jgi:hypothetical protein
MYAFGGALGPTVIGKTSDYFANQAAAIDNVDLPAMSAAERLPYRALGLNKALYALPVTSLLLAGSLFAGARTVNRDVDNLQRWMRETAGSPPPKPRLEKAVT